MFSAGTASSDERLDRLLVGYLTWAVAGAGYASISKDVTDEAQAGTLEQLFLSPFGFRRVAIARAVVQVLAGFATAAVLAVVAMLGTGRWLDLPLASVAGVLALASLSMVGVGLALAGATLAHRRMSAVALLLNIMLIGIVSVPAYPWNGLSVLPFAYAASAVRDIATGHAGLTAATLAIVAVNSAVYLAAGIAIYVGFERRALHRGALGRQ